MADPQPLIGMLPWDLVAQQTLVIGALGGLFLGLGHFAREAMTIRSPEPKKGQLFKVHLPLFIILPLLGGGLAYLTIGPISAFLTGLGALAFILQAVGALPSYHRHQAKEGKGNVPADH